MQQVRYHRHNLNDLQNIKRSNKSSVIKDAVILWGWVFLQALHMSAFKIRIAWLCIALTVNSVNWSLDIATTAEPIADRVFRRKIGFSPHVRQKCSVSVLLLIWLLLSVNHFLSHPKWSPSYQLTMKVCW